MSVKVCCRCHDPKPGNKENFQADKRSKDGLADHCKTCESAYRKHRRKYLRTLRRAMWGPKPPLDIEKLADEIKAQRKKRKPAPNIAVLMANLVPR